MRATGVTATGAARGALWAVTGVVWLAVGRLAAAFLGNELDWRTVAEQSRRDAPWYYRLAGMWGSSEGSLLVFAAIVGLVASLAARHLRRPAVLWFAALTVAALTAVDLLFTSPFDRLDAPAIRGFGLTPILEHPAMAVHPPLLYAGLGCAFAAGLVALDGGRPASWLRATVAVVTVAMALGALWSYVEQGWGGYWAWDPVENTSLLVWLAALVALHAPGRWWLDSSAWLAALAGTAMVRSGATPSIHGFAEQASVGRALLAVTAVTAVTVWWLRPTDRHQHEAPAQIVPAIAGTVVLALVALGTFTPLVVDLLGDRPSAVRGVFFSRTVGPIALVTVPFLVLRLRTRHARLAHVGVLVLLVGIAATTFDREEEVVLGDGLTVQAAGLTVIGRGVAVQPGPRFDVDAVVATVEVDGVTMRPSLVAYPERGGVLAETAVHTRPWRDVQVTLLDATDAGGVRLVVRQRPLTWLVWIGAALTAAGALSAGRRRPAAPADEPASSPAAR